jgi:hypothetical protein
VTWEEVLLSIITVETAVVAWFARGTYRRISEELKQHATDIKRLDLWREHHDVEIEAIQGRFPAPFHHRERPRDD